MNISRPIFLAEKPVVLFLQGPPSSFWPRLADSLDARGFEVIRVNFHVGDFLFWRRRRALNFTGSLQDWPAYLRRLIADRGVTDILYYADQLPYHRAAREIAEAANIRPWAVENGYLRPDWLTMEPGGMGAVSTWPRDPQAIRMLAAAAPAVDMTVQYSTSFAQEAVGEVIYNGAMVLGRLHYPRYSSDKYQNPLIDYFHWWFEAARSRRHRRHAEAVQARAFSPDAPPFHLVAMQLQSDYQVRASSPYEHLSEMLAEIAHSFARSAPAHHRLIVKLHPLDNGSEKWSARIEQIMQDTGLQGRIDVIKGGDLKNLITHSKGVVLANSTVGLHALQLGKPVKALGCAIFDMPGLTHQGALDSFWATPEPVDRELCDALVRALAQRIQIKGSFYNREGQAAAIAEITDRLSVAHISATPAMV